MGDETKTGGTGPDDLKKSSATEGDTEGQRWKLPNATGDTAGPEDLLKRPSEITSDDQDTEGQRWKLPNATGDEPGAGPDDQHKTS